MGDPAVVKVFDTTLRDGEQSPAPQWPHPKSYKLPIS